MELVKDQTIAEWLGISAVRVRELVGKGVIPKAGRNRYDLPACVLAYTGHLRAQAARAGRPPADDTPEGRTAKERLTEAQADLAQTKAAAARGELLPRQAVVAEWQTILADLRSRIMAVPGRCAGRLGHLGASDVATIRAELHDALRDLSGSDE